MDRTVTTVATCIYATPEIEATILTCLQAIEREFPNDTRFACLDNKTERIETHCLENGWRVVWPTSGKPPRMKTMLQLCLDATRTEYFWTIEHDSEPHEGIRDKVHALMDKHPTIAGIDCVTVAQTGHPNYPNEKKPRKPYKGDDELQHLMPHLSLNCTCWRVEALRALDWDKIPEFPATDKHLSRALRKAGWELCIACNCKATHHYARARRYL